MAFNSIVSIMAKTVFQYGGRKSSVTFFSEAKKIPEHIVSLLKNSFGVWRIINAKMIETQQGSKRSKFFLVQLEDEYAVRFVSICDERIELVKQFCKQ